MTKLMLILCKVSLLFGLMQIAGRPTTVDQVLARTT